MKKLALALMLAVATPAVAAPADDLDALLADHYAWLLRQSPVQATALGVRDYDDSIGEFGEDARQRRLGEMRAFLARLDAIPAAALSPGDRTDQAILKRMLAEGLEAERHGQRKMLFTTYYGWHQGFADIGNSVPLRTKADYESYLTRLSLYPQLNDSSLALTAEAIEEGHVLPCSVLSGVERSISGVIAEDPRQSRFYEHFTRTRPIDASEAEWAAMQARAARLVTDVLNPAYAKHLDFYTSRYLPHCAKSDSISDQPGGADYYAFRVRQETTTDLTPDQIHAIGLAEAARIRAEMEAVAREAGFPSREAYIAELRTNTVHFAKTPEALMAATARVNKTIDGQMPAFFRTLPRLPYGLRQIPAEIAEGTTTAYYSQGSPESGLSGTYYVNTSKLDQRPLWEIPALSLHESVPGHHHQIALQQEIEIAPFRQSFAFFTAFTEGWGLYAESLGEEMGLYDTPAKRMGQLSYQMWRATRLVVDTGIHAKGWDKARAIAFMKDNTALTDANIEAEVNRYISWPAQALGYMIGNIRIRELRAKAEAELGPKFDLRGFHDAVLLQGSVPLDVLERQVEDWIAAAKAS